MIDLGLLVERLWVHQLAVHSQQGRNSRSCLLAPLIWRLIINWPPMNIVDHWSLFYGGCSSFVCCFSYWNFSASPYLTDILLEVSDLYQASHQVMKMSILLRSVSMFLVVSTTIFDPFWLGLPLWGLTT